MSWTGLLLGGAFALAVLQAGVLVPLRRIAAYRLRTTGQGESLVKALSTIAMSDKTVGSKNHDGMTLDGAMGCLLLMALPLSLVAVIADGSLFFLPPVAGLMLALWFLGHHLSEEKEG
jgi:hypothetical protein